MNINFLLEKKAQVEALYESELAKSRQDNNPDAYVGKLKDLQREIDILSELINIYSAEKSANPAFLVSNLENLYIWMMSKKTKDEYDNLSDDEIINESIGLFPARWAFNQFFPIDKKINYLEAAIIYDTNLSTFEGIQYLNGKETKHL